LQGASFAVFFIAAAVWGLAALPADSLGVSSTVAPPHPHPAQVIYLSFVDLSSVEN